MVDRRVHRRGLMDIVLVPPLWRCKKCKREFANRNQSHSCGTHDLDHHFEGKPPEIRALFDRIAALVESIGPARILPEKTRIAFQVRMSFAQVTPRRRWIDGHVVLARRREHARFRRIETFSPRNHLHAFRIASVAELDAEFRSWMTEAYAVGAQEHLVTKVTRPRPARGRRTSEVSMKSEVPMRLVLVDPPAGIDFGIQHGRGAGYDTSFVQQSTRDDLVFDFSMKVTESRDGRPSFQGPFAQGPPAGRFVYVDVGTYAGQKNTHWSRRMIVRLQGITSAQIKKATSQPGRRLLARIPGRGKDGSPSCATVQILGGWQVIEDH